MLVHLDNIIPGLPPVSIVTLVCLGMGACSMGLYLLSRIPELLVLGVVAGLYAVAPVYAMIKGS